MTLVVETGSGVADAESFGSVSESDAYASGRGLTDWAVNTSVKEAALRYAADWLDEEFEYPGSVVSSAQRFGLPCSTFTDRRGRSWAPAAQVAQAFKAQCEMAVAHLTSALNEVRDRGGNVQSIRVGPISKTWAQSAAAGKTYPFIQKLMAPITIGGGPGTFRLMR